MRPGRPGAAVAGALLEPIAALLEEYSGLTFDDSQRRALGSAVAGRMEATGSPEPAAYLELLRRARSGEMQKLVEAAANAETTFFRNAPHFRVLREVVLPSLRGRCDRLLLWSAGCSTGEEPYSLAIACLETGAAAEMEVRVLGTDISRTALDAAESGEYPARKLARLDPALRERYFERSPRGWRVRDEVRSLVSWGQHNLVDPALPVPPGSVDVLFCQNVTIYFRPEAIRAVAERLASALREGAHFFPGFAETLWCRAPGLEMVGFGDCFVYRKGGPRPGTTLFRPAGIGRARSTHRMGLRAAPRPAAPPDPGVADAVAARATRPVSARTEATDRQSPSVPAAGGQGAPAEEIAALMAEARAAASAGQLGVALEAASRAVDADPLLAESWELLGLLFRQAGRTDEAESAFRRQLYLAPESPLPHFHLATLYREGGRADDAAREYSRAARVLESIPPETLLAGVTADLMLTACRQYGAGGQRK